MLNEIDRSTTFYTTGQALLQTKYNAPQATNISQNITIAVSPQMVRSTVIAALKVDNQTREFLDVQTKLAQDNTQTVSSSWLGRQVEIKAQGESIPINGRLLHFEQLNEHWQVVVLPCDSTPLFLTNVFSIRLLDLEADALAGLRATNANTLMLRIRGSKRVPKCPPQRSVELSYLSNEMSWLCAFTLLLNADSTEIVSGQAKATLYNRTLFALNRTSLRVVIGEPNRAQDIAASVAEAKRFLTFAQSAPTSQTQESQYYVMTIPGKHTVPAMGELQQTLFEIDHLSTVPFYRYALTPYTNGNWIPSESSNNNNNSGIPNKSEWGIRFSTEEQVWPLGPVTVYQEAGADEDEDDSDFDDSASCVSRSSSFRQPPPQKYANHKECVVQNTYPTYAGATTLSRATPPNEMIQLQLGKSEILTGRHVMTIENSGVENRAGYIQRINVQGELTLSVNVASSAEVYLSYAGAPNAGIKVDRADIYAQPSQMNNSTTSSIPRLEFAGAIDGAFRWYIVNWTAPSKLFFRLSFTVATQSNGNNGNTAVIALQ